MWLFFVLIHILILISLTYYMHLILYLILDSIVIVYSMIIQSLNDLYHIFLMYLLMNFLQMLLHPRIVHFICDKMKIYHTINPLLVKNHHKIYLTNLLIIKISSNIFPFYLIANTILFVIF